MNGGKIVLTLKALIFIALLDNCPSYARAQTKELKADVQNRFLMLPAQLKLSL